MNGEVHCTKRAAFEECTVPALDGMERRVPVSVSKAEATARLLVNALDAAPYAFPRVVRTKLSRVFFCSDARTFLSSAGAVLKRIHAFQHDLKMLVINGALVARRLRPWLSKSPHESIPRLLTFIFPRRLPLLGLAGGQSSWPSLIILVVSSGPLPPFAPMLLVFFFFFRRFALSSLASRPPGGWDVLPMAVGAGVTWSLVDSIAPCRFLFLEECDSFSFDTDVLAPSRFALAFLSAADISSPSSIPPSLGLGMTLARSQRD